MAVAFGFGTFQRVLYHRPAQQWGRLTSCGFALRQLPRD
jgi:hypothetical protein